MTKVVNTMLRNDQAFNQYDDTDVYAGVTHPYFNDTSMPAQNQAGSVATQSAAPTDNGEFSLASIQQRLGNITTANEQVSGADVMPSQSTLNMSYQRDYRPQTEARSTVSTKTKAIAISYAAVVLCLVLAVTLCAVSVGATFGSYVALDQAYNTALEQSAVLDGQIAAESANVEQMYQRASELGYVDAAETNTHFYQRLDTRPAQNYQIESNWFDSLCDWISEVFGG